MDNMPLAEKLRPSRIKDVIGQEHILGNEGIVKKLLDTDKTRGFFPSLILWGPPGCGKTTLARIIAKEINRPFYEFSAVNASVKEIEKAISGHEELNSSPITKQKELTFEGSEDIEDENIANKAPVVFIDEIHRFNKSQQDALLPHVEKGVVILIGATTENPSFEVISPLLSRCRVLVLNQLSPEELTTIIDKGVNDLKFTINEGAKAFLAQAANGDARVALNVLDIASKIAETENITVTDVEQALQRKQLNFDLKGEEFYNTISALHKSVRGSDPDAALYWLARMLEAGQDPTYIARRMIRAASEDIGMADPNALTVALAAFNACEKLGMPECNLALAEAIVYLAIAPKSNALYMAYGEVKEDVKSFGNLPVPMHIRNAPTKLMKDLGYGKNYDYSHSPTGDKKENIDYLPEKIKERRYISKRLKDIFKNR